jgi:hypothetical protein
VDVAKNIFFRNQIQINVNCKSILYWLLILGPLVAKKYGTYMLAGIISFGTECNERQDAIGDLTLHYDDDYEIFTAAKTEEKDYFGLYTNVASYVDWISENSDYTECQISKYLQTNILCRDC